MHQEQGSFLQKHSLTEEELEKLRIALKVLSDAEKQLRASSSDQKTWLIAALLQFGPDHPFPFSVSSSRTIAIQSPITLSDMVDSDILDYKTKSSRHAPDKYGQNGQNLSINPYSRSRFERTSMKDNIYELTYDQHCDFTASMDKFSPMTRFEERIHPFDLSPLHDDSIRESAMDVSRKQHTETLADSSEVAEENVELHSMGPADLAYIWTQVLERCSSISLRQLLHTHAKLLSVAVSEVDAVVYLEFQHPEHKSRGGRSQKRISTMFQAILGVPVEVKFNLASLPAGQHLNSSTGAPIEKPSIIERHLEKCNAFTAVNSGLQLHRNFLETGRLHLRRSRAEVTSGRITHETDTSQIFSAIPDVHKEGQHFEEDTLPTIEVHVNPSCSDWQRETEQRASAMTIPSAWFASKDMRDAVEQENIVMLQGLLFRSSPHATSQEREAISENSIQQSEPTIMNGEAKTSMEVVNKFDTSFSKNREEMASKIAIEAENMRLESQLKYSHLLGCKTSKVYEDKARRRHHHQRKSGLLVRLMPCAKTEKQQ